jgi:hypothetical protein
MKSFSTLVVGLGLMLGLGIGIPVSGQNIDRAEYFFNADPGIGNGTSLSFSPSSQVALNAEIDALALPKGFNRLYLRLGNNLGKWGFYETRLFYMDELPTDVGGSSRTIVGAEYFFDQDPGVGQGTPLSVQSDGKIFAEITEPDLAKGFRRLYVRYKDSSNKWGLYEARLFYKDEISMDPESPLRSIVGAEYFFDQDPGVGQGTALTILPDGKILAEITEPDLSKGFHRLFVRYRDNLNKWGFHEARLFYKDEISSDPESPLRSIVGAEYFFDQDPGVGQGTALTIQPDGKILAEITEPDLSKGFHRLFVRYRDNLNKWGFHEARLFYKDEITINPESPLRSIVRAEYFFDQDPGVGQGTALTVQPDGKIFAEIPEPDLIKGFHRLYVRYRDSTDKWGLYEARLFYKDEIAPISGGRTIVAAEYFFDQDPGVGNGNPLTVLSNGRVIAEIEMNDFPLGFHRLYVRYQDNNGTWGLYENRLFYVDSNVSPASPILVDRVEYFYDGNDPGLGNAPEVAFKVNTLLRLDELIATSGLAAGDHTLHLRIRNTQGNWSDIEVREFTIEPSEEADPPVPDLEVLPDLSALCAVTVDDLVVPTATDALDGTIQGTTDLSIFPVRATGTTAITWTFTNSAGMTTTQEQKIIITDNEAPLLTAPDDIVVGTGENSCSVTIPLLGNPSVSDNCAVASLTNNAPLEFPLGETLVVWTATDGSGNTSTAIQMVVVEDMIAPTITAPANMTITLPVGSTEATNVNLGTPSVSDNCTVASVINDAPSAFPIGTTTVTWTVFDSFNNSATATQLVTVIAQDLPTITAPEDITVNTDLGECAASDVALGTPVWTGDASESNITNDAPAIFPIGNTLVTWTLTDIQGNTVQDTQLVTVIDNEAPVIIAPENVFIELPQSSPDATEVFLGTADTADNCTVASVSNDAPSSFPVGTTTVTWTVIDGAGNSATDIQLVVVSLAGLPTLVAPADITVNTDAGTCEATGVNLGLPTSNIDILEGQLTNDAPSSYPLGTTVVTWTLTDSNGNTVQDTQTVTVVDNEAPVIEAPTAITLSTDSGQCTASGVTLGDAVTSDNCSVASVSNNAPTVFPIGESLVTWTVTDGSGNIATATQLVTVLDNELPSIAAPAAVTVNTDTGLCSASGVALGTPVTSDNCSVASVSNNAPSVFLIGETLVTWTVTDGSGNMATATQLVTVLDNELPSIAAPAAVTVNTDTGLCSASGVALGTPETSDNCSVASVSNNAPSVFPIGETLITWTVTDGSGNIATATQLVTVLDNELPTIAAPAAVTVNTDTGLCSASGVALGTPVTSDNCSVASVSNNAPSVFLIGETLITWTVTDGSGNIATATQLVTVLDNELPTIAAPAAVTVNTDTGLCSASDVALGTPGTSDNCSVASVSNNAPASFPLGETVVVWTVTDGSGNTSTATQLVTVLDTELPVIVAPNNITINLPFGSNEATEVELGEPTVSDNCTVVSVTNNAPGSFPEGTTTVTWTVIDSSGNFATATQTVTVTVSDQPPVDCFPGQTWTAHQSVGQDSWSSLTFGADKFVAVAQNRVMSSMDGINWTAHSVPEANNWRSVAYGNGKFVAVAASGANRVMSSPDGINWTAHNIPGDTFWNSVAFGDGKFVAVASFGTDRVMSSSDGINWTFHQVSEFANWRSVTYGNGRFVAVGDFESMTSIDGINWTTSTTPRQAVSITYGDGKFVAVYGDPERMDMVLTSTDGVNWSIQLAAAPGLWRAVAYGDGRFVAVSRNMVMSSKDAINWNAHEVPASLDWNSIAFGNGKFVSVAGFSNQVMVSECPRTPNEIVPDLEILPDVQAQCIVSFDELLIPTATDEAGNTIQGTTDISIFPITAQGTTLITWTYTDQGGNSITQTQTIRIEDTEAPAVLTQDLEFEIEEGETLTISPESVDAGSFDNCGPVTLGLDKTIFTDLDEGQNIITLTVTDAADNVNSAQATVTIIVNRPPCKVVALANNLTVALDKNGQASITTRQVNNGSFSECVGGSLTLTLSQSTFSCSNLGTNEVTLTATDRNGNQGSTLFIVTVVDNIAPTIAKLPKTVKVSIAANTSYTVPDFRLTYPATDNCSVVNYTQSPAPGTVYTSAGVYPVTLIATDQSGNVRSGTFNIELSVTQSRGGGRNRSIDMNSVLSVAWNTPFSDIENMEIMMVDEAGEERSYRVSWNADDYDPLTPGFYQIRGTALENISFRFKPREEDPVMHVFVEDKPRAMGIELDSNTYPSNMVSGQVIGRLNTIDPVDNIHSYSLDNHPQISLMGDEIIWNGEEKPAASLSITVHSTDRAGQTISRELTLYREVDPNRILIYPNPATRESNILVQLSGESEVTIRVFDAAGRSVYEEQGRQSETFVRNLDLRGLSSGMYHIVVQIDNKVLTGRLVKDL